MEEKNKKIFYVIILVVSLFSLAIFSGYLLEKREDKRSEVSRVREEEFESSRMAIIQQVNEGRSYQEILDEINGLLEKKQFNNARQLANLKIMEASLYLSGPNEADFKKGIYIAKEVVINNDYPAIWRALGLERLADFVKVSDISFAKENIFNDIYFSAMLEEEDLDLARRRLYEKSLSLHDSVVPHYEVAKWYAMQLLEDMTLSAGTRESYLQSAKMNLEEGEKLFNEDYPKNVWDDDRLIMAYKNYAEAATELYLLGEFKDSQKIIDSYEKAITFYEKKYDIQKWPVTRDKIPSPTRLLLPSLVFSYASSLAIMQKPVDQDKIQTLLEILYDKNWQKERNIFSIFNLFKNQKEAMYDNTFMRFLIASLAKADSRFASLLTGMGWTNETINNLSDLPFFQSTAE